MKPIIIKGAGVAIVTPMHADGSVNYDKLGDLIDFQFENQTDAIIICGTTGESSTLTHEEHTRCIRFTVARVAHRIPVVAGTGSNDTVYGVELSREAVAAGADALLLVTPYYNKTSQSGLIRHFLYTADHVDAPIIVYNVPSRTGLNIKPATYKELSKHPRIVATKEASGDISQIAQIAALCGDDLHIYSGNDDQLLPILSLGGLGVISVASNVAPREVHELCARFFAGDVAGARELQLRLLPLMNALFCECSPIPVKAAMNLMGFDVGEGRMPLAPACDSTLELLRSRLRELSLLP